jgi:hypothetical protein
MWVGRGFMGFKMVAEVMVLEVDLFRVIADLANMEVVVCVEERVRYIRDVHRCVSLNEMGADEFAFVLGIECVVMVVRATMRNRAGPAAAARQLQI